MAHTQSVEQLAADLKTAQDALRNVQTILKAISTHPENDSVFYDIGRAIGTASQGVIMSGGER